MRHKLVQSKVTMTSADTQVSFVVPDGARSLLFKLRSGTAKLTYYLVTANPDSLQSTLSAGSSRRFSNVIFAKTTFFFKSPSASQTLEIEYIINQ